MQKRRRQGQTGRRILNAYSAFRLACSSCPDHSRFFLRGSVDLREHRPTRAARVHAASVPRRRLYLDARLLGLRSRWLLLGPGTWVTPPTVGVLWTPGYWGWGEGVYVW